jgi:micrococcal nuclease
MTKAKLLVLHLLFVLYFTGCPGTPIENESENRFMASVAYVVDGDSIRINRQGKDVNIRIGAIDAPEMGQELGPESRENLVKLIGRSRVVVVATGRDRYGRMLADIFVDDRNVGLAQIYDGMAWNFKNRSTSRSEYQEAESDARLKGNGIWKTLTPQPPWEWRKDHPRKDN